MIIVAGALVDKAVRGRVHRVWWIGGGLVIASQAAGVAIALTPAWTRFCTMLAGG